MNNPLVFTMMFTYILVAAVFLMGVMLLHAEDPGFFSSTKKNIGVALTVVFWPLCLVAALLVKVLDHRDRKRDG